MDCLSFFASLAIFILIAVLLIRTGSRIFGYHVPFFNYSGSLIIFTRQLARMLNMNLPLIEALSHLREEIGRDMSTGKYRLLEALPHVEKDLEQGLTFSQCIARCSWVFPPIYAGLVAVGERNDNLPAVLEETALFMEKSKAAKERFIDIIIYPSIILVVLILIIHFLMRFILPTFVSLFESMGSTLPLVTKIVITATRFSNSPVGFVFLLLLLLVMIVIAVAFRHFTGYSLVDYCAFKLPLIGKATAMKEYASFSGLMGALLGSSVQLGEALLLVASTLENSFIRTRIMRVARESPAILSSALRASGVFQPSYLWMVLAGERTETLDEVLKEMEQFYGEESRLLLSRFMGWLQPLFVVTMGILTVICTTSVFLPLVQLVVIVTKDIVH